MNRSPRYAAGLNSLTEAGGKCMRVIVAATAGSLMLIGLSRAGDAKAAIREPTHIPPEPLGRALQSLAKERNLVLAYRSEVVGNARTSGASGVLTREEALSQLLKGTGLTYRFLDEKTVTILPPSAPPHSAGATQAPTVHGSSGSGASSTSTTPTKEGKRSSSSSFRLAQMDQGASARPDAVSPANEREANSEPHLTEIIVTAQRRPEKIQSVPISMTAFSQATLDTLNIDNLTDLAAVVPGLVVSTPGTLGQSDSPISIRGIFTDSNSPTTAIYINDTPVMIRQLNTGGASGSPRPDIFDLERVEVLRGPQGTLFGASAMGGAIRYITHPPDMESVNGYSKAEVGFTDTGAPSYDLGLAYGAPIVPEHLGFRVSGWYQSSGGFVDMENPYSGAITRNANSASTYVLQGALTWAPVRGLQITPTVFVQHHHSRNKAEYWETPQYLPNNDPGRYVDGANISSPTTDDLGVYMLGIAYQLQNVSFESNTSYLDRAYQGVDDLVSIVPAFFGGPAGAIPGLSAYDPYQSSLVQTRQWQQEFRLTSENPQSRLQWVVGAYFRHSLQQTGYLIPTLTPATEALFGLSDLQLFGVPDFVVNGQPFSNYGQFTTIDEQKALFANATFGIITRLKVEVGIRVEHDSVTGQKNAYAGPIYGTPFAETLSPDEVENPITPRAGITYQFTPDNMLYVTAAKGYRLGGSNPPSVTEDVTCNAASVGYKSVPKTYGSDKLWSYELGTKNSLFDRRLVIDASAFYIDWTGIQSGVGLPSCGEAFTTNLGKAISQGFDLQLSAVPARGLSVIGDVGYTDAYYPNAAYGALNPRGVRPVLNIAGQRLPRVIPWTAALDVEYSWSLGRIWEGARSYVRADYRYVGEVPGAIPADAGYDPRVGLDPSDAYKVVNLRMGLTCAGLDLSLFVDNATHADPRFGILHQGGPSNGLVYATALRPLTAGITALYRF